MPSKKGKMEDFFGLESEVTEPISLIDLDLIEPDPNQPRKIFDEESIKSLAQSIQEKGLLQPILVRKEGEKYLIISGERRYRAFKYLGKSSMPCIVKDIKSEKDIRAIQIIENLQREDISQIERAKALRELIANALGIKEDGVLPLLEKYKFDRLSEEEKEALENVVKPIGKSVRTIERWIKLLTLPEEIQKKIDSPDSPLTVKHVEKLYSIKDEKLLFDVVSKIERENISAEKVEQIVKKKKLDYAKEMKKAVAILQNIAVNVDLIDGEQVISILKDLKFAEEILKEIKEKLK